MFYRPEDGHGLPHNPFAAIVAPRPIAWVSTRGPLGDNLAPYSFFMAVAYAPMQIAFASNGEKDTLRAIRASGVFAVNVVGAADMAAMNATSAALPPGTDEFVHAGLEKAECVTIPCPRLAEAPATLECRLLQEIPAKGVGNFLILGEVTGVHLRPDCLKEGRFEAALYQPLARLGYMDYAVIERTFPLPRPDQA